MKKFGIVVLWVLGLGFSNHSKAQENVDLLAGKEWAEMSRLNPAFTSVLNEFRFLTAKSGELNFGLEGMLRKNHFGLYYQQNSVDYLSRQQVDFQIARNLELKSGLKAKFGMQVLYRNKLFKTKTGSGINFNFHDFNGFNYSIDSLNFGSLKDQTKYLEAGLGVGATYKNLVFGLNIGNLVGRDISILQGTEVRTKRSYTAQLGGFLNMGNTQLFPNVIYSVQDRDEYMAAGLVISGQKFGLAGQYETVNDLTQFDIGVNYRTERFLFAVNYVYPQIDQYEFSVSDVRFTLNTTINKKKVSEKSILKKMKSIY